MLLDEAKRAERVKGMFASIAGRYDLINSVLSFGIHKLWKRRLLKIATSDRVENALDLCTGTGDLLKGLSLHAKNVVGADFCTLMLAQADKKISTLNNVTLKEADALNLPFADHSFDLVTVAFGVRNFENLERGLKEIQRVLRRGGRLVILEFGQPRNWFFKKIYDCYSALFLPFIGRLLAGNKQAYLYLRESAATFPSDKDMTTILVNLNFQNCRYLSLTGGIAYIYQAETLLEF